MWMLKRRSTESPETPELVSASPISPDTVAMGAKDEISPSKNNNDDKFVVPRKGIFTLKQKVGDMLKRSESSEIISVPLRRRNWSPNIKNSQDPNKNASTKPKKILRVASLRNLFKSAVNTVNGQAVDHKRYPEQVMSKSLSDSVVLFPTDYCNILDFEQEKDGSKKELVEKKHLLSKKINRLEENARVLDLFLDNPNVLLSPEGTNIASQMLEDLEKSPRRASVSVVQVIKKTSSSIKLRSGSSVDVRRTRSGLQKTTSEWLIDSIGNIQLGCEDSSGYDSDSTRTGSDSPDCDISNKMNDLTKKKLEFVVPNNPTEQRTPEKKSPSKSKSWRAKIWNSNTSLLEDDPSPSKDTPPSKKYPLSKRSRNPDFEDELMDASYRLKRPALISRPPSTARKCLFKTQYFVHKLNVASPGDLGISIEQKKGARVRYVVSDLKPDCEAAKLGLRIGDMINQISGFNLRGVPNVFKARNILDSSVGEVVLHVAREPVTNFNDEILVWPQLESSSEPSNDVWGSLAEDKNKPFIFGATRKDGTFVQILPEDFTTDSTSLFVDKTRSEEQLTGMKKFFVRKKTNGATPSKRVTSWSPDTRTIVLEKRPNQKLGFTIVGGCDVNKKMGIFIKTVFPGGAAEGANLKAYDEVMSVNGNSTQGLTHKQAVQLIKGTKQEKILLVVSRRDVAQKKLLSKSFDSLERLIECSEN